MCFGAFTESQTERQTEGHRQTDNSFFTPLTRVLTLLFITKCFKQKWANVTDGRTYGWTDRKVAYGVA